MLLFLFWRNSGGLKRLKTTFNIFNRVFNHQFSSFKWVLLFLPLRQNFFYTVEYRNWKQVQTGYGALTREMEKEIKQLSQVCELWENGVIVESVDGTILSWNKGARDLYGYSADEVIGKKHSFLVPGDVNDDFLSILKS